MNRLCRAFLDMVFPEEYVTVRYLGENNLTSGEHACDYSISTLRILWCIFSRSGI
jgi:hypothetical protein